MKNPDIMMEVNSFDAEQHWTNGNNDPCVDREIYIGGQRVPQQRNDMDFITVILGFLRLIVQKIYKRDMLLSFGL